MEVDKSGRNSRVFYYSKGKVMKGKKLIFLYKISGDGSRVNDIKDVDHSSMNKEKFRMSSLSIRNGTFIASSMNSFIVKIKKNEKRRNLRTCRSKRKRCTSH